MKKYLMIIAMAAALVLGGCSSNEPTGTELLEQGDYAAAVEKFDEAIAEGMNPEESYRGLGIAYWEQEDYQRARAAFEKALNHKAKETATIYNFLGVCDMKLGYMESALSWFEKGLETDDASAELIQEMQFNQIVIYEKLKDWDTAKVKLATYLEAYPDDEQAKKESEFLQTR